MVWEIEFSQEASNDAIDSLPYNEDVLVAIEKLAERQEGWPDEGSFQILEEWCIWEIAGHIVVYERERTVFHLYVWLIKPQE